MGAAIVVKGLRKTYGTLQAVDGVDITVRSGQVFGLLGANGAGKTTTLECILGVKKADQGTIEVLGVNPQVRNKELFEEVGVQFQESSFQDKITVRELCEVTSPCMLRQQIMLVCSVNSAWLINGTILSPSFLADSDSVCL